MDPTNGNNPERVLTPVAQPNAAPGLGVVAANMDPGANPNAMPTMPEVAPIQTGEVLSVNPETQIGPGQSGGPLMPAPAMPVPQQPVVQPTTSISDNSTVNATAPTVAADVDLIEKEWVDHAKKIINSTKSDPYEQARLVAELMRDYIRKRYGKEVGKASDD